MNDKQLAASKRAIQKRLEYWQPLLLNADWEVEVKYSREPLDSNDDGTVHPASVEAKWEYLKAFIRFDCNALSDYSEADLDEVIVHELVHILVNELVQWGPDDQVATALAVHKHEERTTSQLAKAILKAHNHVINQR